MKMKVSMGNIGMGILLEDIINIQDYREVMGLHGNELQMQS